jgi:hypothetical protein
VGRLATINRWIDPADTKQCRKNFLRVHQSPLGAEQYRKLLGSAGISVAEEYEDEGDNHYFDAFKGKKA